MSEIFVISDTHFGHKSMLSFKNAEGHPERPFTSVEEMDELMIANWNRVVRPCDKVYHLGDVAMKLKAMKAVMPRLNGRKTLLAGNHDIFNTKEYMKFFENMRGVRVIDGCLLSHFPVKSQSATRYRLNIHGHTHSRRYLDPFYFCVCVEQTNYTPVPWAVITKMLRERDGS